MKGIILAGGSGSRLYPLTKAVTKQLLPVYSKPLIYYPLSVLMLAGIREILVISDPKSLPKIEDLLGTGEQFGLDISYAQQEAPRGLPEAFTIGSSFIGNDSVCLVLGDNIFYGRGLTDMLEKAASFESGCVGIACHVSDPGRYGVVEFSASGEILSLEEKPEHPRSNYALTGIYFCDSSVCEIARSLQPSARGETEILDVCRRYHSVGRYTAFRLGRGVAWMDAGTPSSLLQASLLVESIENRLGLLIGSPEEIAHSKGFILFEEFESLVVGMPDCEYRDRLGSYLAEARLTRGCSTR